MTKVMQFFFSGGGGGGVTRGMMGGWQKENTR